MNESQPKTDDLPFEAQLELERLAEQFELELRDHAKGASIADALSAAKDQNREQLFGMLLELECDHRRRSGGQPDEKAYLSRFPQYEDLIRRVIRDVGGKDASTVGRGPGSVQEGPGSVIGSYKLLQVIGEGGFGVVYMAEQSARIRRKVALKIIKPGMDTKEVIARFEAERQALALMDHPNIAHVFDGGTTKGHRPYFVMELVKGVSITEYCDKNKSSTHERLELFTTICQAVQHAHQKGVIHRDLKPSNVLVTLHDGKPVVKVIDFGVAKALNQQLTENTLFTAFGQMVGTVQYMSPEQAEMSGLDVDTRSDIYSLGVILYELLAGSTPLVGKQLRDAGYVELQRIIREEEPPQPSVRLSSADEDRVTIIASHRSTDPRQLRKTLRGELDWIVMKSLEKERGRRYQSAQGFADDVTRHLQGKPVLARKPTAWYLFIKAARRHRATFAVGALMFVCVLVAIGGIFAGWYRAEIANADLAQKNAELAQQQYADLVNLMYEAWDVGDIARFNDLMARATELDGREGFELHFLRQCQKSNRPLGALSLDALINSISVSRSGAEAIGLNDGSILYRATPVESFRCLSPGNRLVASDKESRHRADVCFTGDGKHLIAAAGGGINEQGETVGEEVQIWACGEQMRCVSRIPHESTIHGVTVSEDGRRGASGCYDGSFKVWSIPQGNVEWDQPSAHSGAIRCLAFLPGADSVSTGSDTDDVVHTWSISKQERMHSTPSNGTQEICCSPDGRTIAIASNVEVRLYALSRRGFTPTPKVLRTRAWDLSFSQDGGLLAIASPNHTVALIEVANWQQVKRFMHPHAVQSVAFDPSESRLLTGCMDKQLRAWATNSNNEVAQCVEHYIIPLAIDLNGRIATSRNDNGVWLWDPQGNGSRLLHKHSDYVTSVAFDNAGNRVASCSQDGTVVLYDLAKGVKEGHWKYPVAYSVAFSTDSNWLASGSEGKVHLHNLREDKIRSIPVENDYVLSSAFSDEYVVASGGVWWSHGTTNLWTWRDGDMSLVESFSHPNISYPAVFSPDGKLLAMPHGFVSGVVRVYDVDSERCNLRFELKAHRMQTNSLAFSPDGSRLLTASADQSMKIWDSATGQRLGVLRAKEQIRNLQFAPNGDSVVTASNEGILRIWPPR